MSSPYLDVALFNNLRELLRYLDERIGELEAKAREIDEVLSSLRPKVERYKSILKMIEEIVGKGQHISLSTSIEVSGLKLVLDPRPIDEYELYEEVRKAIADRLLVLKKVRDLIDSIASRLGDKADVPVTVEFKMGVPIKLVFKMGESR